MYNLDYVMGEMWGKTHLFSFSKDLSLYEHCLFAGLKHDDVLVLM